MNSISPFHLAIPVHDIESCRNFYTHTLELEEGRSSDHWVDYNFFGHQLVCHLSDESKTQIDNNPVDGKHVPVPHFGVVLQMEQWRTVRDLLIEAQTKFVICLLYTSPSPRDS